MCGFKPFPKLAMQRMALMIVQIMRRIVMTAKEVRERRAGRYVFAREGWYMRTSLKRKYARPPK